MEQGSIGVFVLDVVPLEYDSPFVFSMFGSKLVIFLVSNGEHTPKMDSLIRPSRLIDDVVILGHGVKIPAFHILELCPLSIHRHLGSRYAVDFSHGHLPCDQ